jgi:hypothetical protein
MLVLAARRFASMVLIMAVISFVLFVIFESDKLGVAGKVLGPYSSTEQRELWLEQNGYNRNFFVRYGEWVGNAVTGDFGQSIRFKAPVSDLLWPRLVNTGFLALQGADEAGARRRRHPHAPPWPRAHVRRGPRGDGAHRVSADREADRRRGLGRHLHGARCG